MTHNNRQQHNVPGFAEEPENVGCVLAVETVPRGTALPWYMCEGSAFTHTPITANTYIAIQRITFLMRERWAEG